LAHVIIIITIFMKDLEYVYWETLKFEMCFVSFDMVYKCYVHMKKLLKIL